MKYGERVDENHCMAWIPVGFFNVLCRTLGGGGEPFWVQQQEIWSRSPPPLIWVEKFSAAHRRFHSLLAAAAMNLDNAPRRRLPACEGFFRPNN